MTTTTEYCTWANLANEASVRDGILAAIGAGDDADSYDLDAIEAEYREAIDEILPEGVSLHGDIVYGPYPIVKDWDMEAVSEAIGEIEFFDIVARHEIG